ncbi:MAG TPA: class I SAM-dependent methyltransferase [Longimicrobiaceae bacterium]|nr:class I SAM-dependent methyltransferase [Longimicrobiaceae bacterium]
MEARFNRLVRAIEKRYGELFGGGGAAPAFALQLAGGPTAVFGRGEPEVTVVANDPSGVAALSTLDLRRVGEAYLAGSLDVLGDIRRVLAARDLFRDRHPLLFLYRFVRPLLYGQVRIDRAGIAHHYDEDPDFYLLFLDGRHRCYSQAVFAHDGEPLEEAMSRKIDYAIEQTGLRPGERVLDIGGGWGAFVEHAGRKGIRVTSLTISEPSRRYIQALIDREGLPCEVRLEHFFDHRPAEPYDAVVNLGVTEHLPDYPRSLRRYHDLLKPGGRVYLDASATRVKNDVSTFFERYIFQGNGSPLCLHDYLTALSRTPLEVEVVLNDRVNYLRTTRAWAERLDRHREEVERRWGKAQYRRFQVYLWGCVDGFERDLIQAYRLVLRRPD